MSDYTPRLKQAFRDEIRPTLKERMGLENIMQVPDPGQDRGQHGHR